MYRNVCLLIIFLSIFTINSFSQGIEDKFYVAEIKIEKEKIMLNKVFAFKYIPETNGFTIANKDGKEVIHAVSKTIDQIKTLTTFTFVNLQDIKFTNSTINTAEQLFKMFAENNVIDEKYLINYDQLKGVLLKYDGK